MTNDHLQQVEHKIIVWRGFQRSARTPKEAESCARVVDACLEEWNTVKALRVLVRADA